MLTPQQFKDRWQNEVVASCALPDDVCLVAVPPERLASFKLSDASHRYLVEAGLPKACAPCLNFNTIEKGLRRIWDVFSPGQWQPKDKDGLENYLVIGFDGSGSPFCIDESTSKVILVDHELLFCPKHRDKRVMFVNSGVPELAESLLAHQLSRSSLPEATIQKIDPPAFEGGAFWAHYISRKN